MYSQVAEINIALSVFTARIVEFQQYPEDTFHIITYNEQYGQNKNSGLLCR